MTVPTISVVTPSLNQGAFLERTIGSLLDQRYPALEYVIVDGGSRDESVEIIRRHAGRLAWWVSEPDAGQYEAINKGFARTGGEIMAWLNADDMYLPWTLAIVAEIFASLPGVEWLTTLFPLWWDVDDRAILCVAAPGYSRRGFFRGEHLAEPGRFCRRFIQQESTFWRRSLWQRAGGRLDSSLRLAADFELWARFYQHAELYAVDTPLAGFRWHPAQKTASQLDAYFVEARQVLARHGGRPWGRCESWLRRLGERLPRRLSVPLGLAYPPLNLRHQVRAPGWTICQY